MVVFPTELPGDFSRFQRTWIAYENSREHSGLMTDSFFIAGKPVRLVSYLSGEPVWDCRYVRGSCPRERSVQRSWLG